MIAALQERPRPRRGRQRQRAARRHRVLDIPGQLAAPRRHHQPHDIVAQLRGQVHIRHRLPRVLQALLADRRVRKHRLAMGLGLDEVQDRPLGLDIRQVQHHVQQEPIQLRLGQGKRPLVLYRVLRRHHKERIGQAVRLASRGDLPLAHRLQQRRLHLGRRPVDLVHQHQVMKHRPFDELETAIARLVDRRAGQVGGHQVGRALDARERAFHRPRQAFHRPRLGQPRRAFHQQVPPVNSAIVIRSIRRSCPISPSPNCCNKDAISRWPASFSTSCPPETRTFTSAARSLPPRDTCR